MFYCITGAFVPPGMSLECFWSKIRLPRILKNLFSARKGRFLVIESQQVSKKRQSPEPKSNSLRALREKNFPEIFSEFLHFGHVLGHWESVKRVFRQKKFWDFFQRLLFFPPTPHLGPVLTNFWSKMAILWWIFEVRGSLLSSRWHNRWITIGPKRPETQ